MKPRLRHTLIAAIACVALTGCAYFDRIPPQTTQDAADIANLAAYMGAGIHLADHPQDRPYFEAAVEALDALALEGTWQPAELARALEQLPVDELQGSQGKVIILGAVTIWDKAAKRLIELEDTGTTQAVARAIRDGLALALAQNNPERGAP